MTKRKTDQAKDRELGMDRPITRRDFLNGMAISATAAASGPLFAAPLPPADTSTGTLAGALAGALAGQAGNAQDAYGYYPPLLNGLRGSHPGSFEDAHALRDGQRWPPAQETGEEYDLIVVGGGISGLAAAHFYRAQTSPKSRILVLDNHDDFGGHAKRNEFNLDGHLNLLNGGTLEIDSPRPYGPVAAGLLKTLGLDVPALSKSTQHPKFYDGLGLQAGAFFDAETFGADKLIVGIDTLPLDTLLMNAPLSERARRQIVQIETAKIDYLPGVSSDEKKQRLSRMSYEAFLRDVVQAEPAVLKYYRGRTMGEWGVGTDAVSALDCWALDIPGFQGMNIAKGSISRMGFTPSGYADTGGSYKLHFPDGNATIARLLVRDLIPAAVPGRGVEGIVTARVNYGQLDRPDTPVRLRLNSIVIRARNLGDATAAKTSRNHLPARRASLYGARQGSGHGVLQHDDSLFVPGTPRAAKGRVARIGQNAAGLHQRRGAQLGSVREAQSPSGICARQLSHVLTSECTRRHRHLSKSQIAQGSDPGSHGAYALQTRSARA